MKKILIALICIATMAACKKSTESINAPQKLYFRIQAVDNDGHSTVTDYKVITVN